MLGFAVLSILTVSISLTHCFFIKISETSDHTCTYHGHYRNAYDVMTLFKESKAFRGSLEVHSKRLPAFPDQEDPLKELIEKFCPLPSYNKIWVLYYQSKIAFRGKFVSHLSDNNLKFYSKLRQITGTDCNNLQIYIRESYMHLQTTGMYQKAIVDHASRTAIVIYHEIFSILKESAALSGMSVRKYIQHLVKDRPSFYSFRPPQAIPRFDTQGNIIPLNTNNFEKELVSDYINFSEMILSSFMLYSVPRFFRVRCDDNNVLQYGCESLGFIVSVPELANVNLENPFKDPFFIISKEVPLLKKTIGNHFQSYLYNDEIRYNNFDEISRMDESERSKRYIEYNGRYFDIHAYRKGARLSIIPFLLHVAKVAKLHEKDAILYVEPWIGLSNSLLPPKEGDSENFKLLQIRLLKEFVKEFVVVLQFLYQKNEDLISVVDSVNLYSYHTLSIKDLLVRYTVVSVINTFDTLFNEKGECKFTRGYMMFAALESTGHSYPCRCLPEGEDQNLKRVAFSPISPCNSAVGSLQNPFINPQMMKCHC